MAKEKPTTKVCKHCQNEVPYKAKVCPNCRKRLKGGPLKWILIILAVIIGLSMCNGKDADESQLPSETTTSVQTPDNGEMPSTNDNVPAETQEAIETTPPKTVYTVGDILEDGGMRIVYMSSGEFIEENDFLQPADGYRYIFLQFAFENISEKFDDSISLYSFEGYADGYAVEMYYGGEESLSASLSPGRSTTGYIYFSVPVDAQEIEIEYTTNYFTSDKITFLYEGDKDSGYAPALSTAATPGALQVGDVSESSNLKISYLSCAEYTSDNMFMQPRDGYHFVSCEFEFENLGNSDEYVSSYDFDCYADGMNCEQSFVRDDDLSATLSAGRKAKGFVTFEVPNDANVIELEYLSNYWTSNRVVFTIQ